MTDDVMAHRLIDMPADKIPDAHSNDVLIEDCFTLGYLTDEMEILDSVPCSVSGCTRRAKTRGWCSAHYERWRVHGDIEPEKPVGKLPRVQCLACGKDVRRSTNRYCSHRCSSLHRNTAASLRTLDVHPRSVPVGTTRLRRDKKSGALRVWVKVKEPHLWKPQSVALWESVNGPLPAGYIVHHKDRDCLNDVNENLEAMTRAEHINEHRRELEAAKR